MRIFIKSKFHGGCFSAKFLYLTKRKYPSTRSSMAICSQENSFGQELVKITNKGISTIYWIHPKQSVKTTHISHMPFWWFQHDFTCWRWNKWNIEKMVLKTPENRHLSLKMPNILLWIMVSVILLSEFCWWSPFSFWNDGLEDTGKSSSFVKIGQHFALNYGVSYTIEWILLMKPI